MILNQALLKIPQDPLSLSALSSFPLVSTINEPLCSLNYLKASADT